MSSLEDIDVEIERSLATLGAEIPMFEAAAWEPGSRSGPIDRPIAALIDHTLLAATAVRPEIERVCDEAIRYGFASACINSWWVPLARESLAGTSVSVCTVVGFPLGATATESKAAEAAGAVRHGAEEVDMVIALGPLKSGEYRAVYDDIVAVVEAARGALVKVILETCYLTDPEKIAGCQLARAAGASFVKTSTGFGTGGATVSDVALMRRAAGDDIGVKASGGIHAVDQAERLIVAGADRLGTSSSLALVGAA